MIDLIDVLIRNEQNMIQNRQIPTFHFVRRTFSLEISTKNIFKRRFQSNFILNQILHLHISAVSSILHSNFIHLLCKFALKSKCGKL